MAPMHRADCLLYSLLASSGKTGQDKSTDLLTLKPGMWGSGRSVVKKAAELIGVVLGSAIFALIVTLVVSGISSSGVIGLELTHAYFWLAFWLAVAASPIAAGFFWKSWKYSIICFVATAIVMGVGLWRLDSWLALKKSEQDAINRPPLLTHTSAPPPIIPITKTPLPSHISGKSQQDNSVHIGARAIINQNSNGPCSPNIIGGSNTVNCQSRAQAQLTDKQIDLFGSFYANLPRSIALIVHEGAGDDAGNYGNLIVAALASKNQVIPRWAHSMLPTTGGWKGLDIITSPGQLNIVNQLCKNLIAVQLKVTCYEDERLPTDNVEISVGAPE
jgi:hypothetical protein